MVADVVLPSRRFHIFTYHIPDALLSGVFVGSPVRVPLGSSIVSGVIVRILDPTSLPLNRLSKSSPALRDISSLDATPEQSSLDQKLLTLVEHIAEYYLAPLAVCLRLIVPPRLYVATKRLVLTEVGRQALSDSSVSVERREVLQKISRWPNGVLRSTLLRGNPQKTKHLSKLKNLGWIEERATLPAKLKAKAPPEPVTFLEPGRPVSSRVIGDLFEQNSPNNPGDLSKKAVPSEYVKGQVDVLVQKSVTGKFQKDLVVGIDQDRYLIFQHLASTIFRQGKRVLLLVPEVHQAEAFAKDIRKFLTHSVEVYHGHLSTPVRAISWERIRLGQVQIVVGTRSALFVPIPDLGLIWVDQEEDSSYKEEHFPYYHAREVARMRGQIEQAMVVYGSSYPSLETYSAFRDAIPPNVKMVSANPPVMRLIDMRDHSYGTVFAAPFVERLTQALNDGEQAIILLNRKGFSSSLICRDCGQTPVCEACGVSLRLFHRPSQLRCSYCGNTRPTPETCFACQGTVFRFSGVGTQRLEEELIKVFPTKVLFRFDRDQVKTTEEARRILQAFRQKDIQILIGTEYLLHQPNPPWARLIAFPQADLGLHLPDFRSAERTFLFLSKALQLVQMPGLTNGPLGEIWLQTHMPDHHVFQAIRNQDPHMFFQQELALRDALAYPPSVHLILFVVTGVQVSRVQRAVLFLEEQLKEERMQSSLSHEFKGKLEWPMVLGPLSSKKPGRLQKNRTIFLLKTYQLEKTQQFLRTIQQVYDQQFGKEPVVFEVHVDPLEIQ